MPLSVKSKMSRAWTWTGWDGVPTFDEKKMRYLCFSPETCPESGKHHLQGFVYFKNAMSLTAVQKYLMKTFDAKKGINLLVTKGSPEENRTYCGGAHYDDGKGKVKEPNPDFQEWGKLPVKGSRSDIDAVKDSIMSGETTATDVCVDNPEFYHQYGRTLDRIQTIMLRKKWRTWMTQGYWYYGETGCGKSHVAFKDYDPETHYEVSLSQLARGFWTGYTGQETVIINEFRGQIGFGELMDLVDKWPKKVDVKCGEPVPFLAKSFIITGPKPPAETYSGIVDKGDSINQLYRRFKIYECTRVTPITWKRELQDFGFNEEIVAAPPAAPQSDVAMAPTGEAPPASGPVGPPAPGLDNGCAAGVGGDVKMLDGWTEDELQFTGCHMVE